MNKTRRRFNNEYAVNKMNGKKELKKLVEHFCKQRKTFCDPTYKEAQVRQEFIDKFFQCLGWDVYNEKNHMRLYQEVIVEESLDSKGSKTEPDYTFRMNGDRIFLVEAKKPSENIEVNTKHAYQLKRYAWNAGTPISILTNFEEFSVYDCTRAPERDESATVSRIKYMKCEEYYDHFEELWSCFSKEAVTTGSFDGLVNSFEEKRERSEVDEVFLKNLECWRKNLAIDLANRNKCLSVSELNFCVQRILDRIIFLRICEDRGMEPSCQLKHLISNSDIYKSFCDISEQAEKKYNSGLFDFESDKITRKMNVDDEVFSKIIGELYYPKSPYDFAIIKVEILGNAYERFLGKTINLTKTRRVKIEQKPEIKKAGGIFYTPKFIVNYIVKNAVERVLKNKTPKTAEKIRILDPACGSGAFLVVAYIYLLDWHLDYYLKHQKTYGEKIYQKDGRWFLTTEIKKKILMNNIFGVDVDSQAVEITKLSLLLKVLENESNEAINQQRKLFQEKALPNLQNNIRCGNSLVDYSIQKYSDMKEKSILEAINPFDWNNSTYGFGQIMSEGGFDVVIGNPPYVRIQNMDKNQVKYLKENYESPLMTSDIYPLFIESGICKLKSGAFLCFITPNKFFSGKSGSNIRQFIHDNCAIKQIIHFGTNQIFQKATTYTCILTLKKDKKSDFEYKEFPLGAAYGNLTQIKFEKRNKGLLNKDDWNFKDVEIREILTTISKNGIRFDNITDKIFKGFSTGDEDVFVLECKKQKKEITTVYSKALDCQVDVESTLLHPYLNGKDIRQYEIEKTNKMILYPYKVSNMKGSLIPINDMKSKFPLTLEYLTKCRIRLKKRAGLKKNDVFYKYSAIRSSGYYGQKKILIPDILVSNRIAFDVDGVFHFNAGAHGVIFKKTENHDPLYYLGILNSNLFWFFIKNTSTALSGDAYRLIPQYLKPFPFPITPKQKDIEYEKSCNKIITYVNEIIKFKKEITEKNLESEQIQIMMLIKETENSLNMVIYGMYGLSDSEIGIIEKSI